MFNKLLIIGCGLIGSSVLRAVSNKKLSKKIFVYEKSKKNISKIKKLKISCSILTSLKKNISNIVKFRQYLLENKIYYPSNGIIFLSNSTSYKSINYVLKYIKFGLKKFF